VMENLDVTEAKTKSLKEQLGRLNLSKRALVTIDDESALAEV
jgi:hypothetical protein